MVIGRPAVRCLSSSLRSSFSSPTSTMSALYSLAAKTAPSTSAAGELSPPIASKAIVILIFLPVISRQQLLLPCLYMFRRRDIHGELILFRGTPDTGHIPA